MKDLRDLKDFDNTRCKTDKRRIITGRRHSLCDSTKQVEDADVVAAIAASEEARVKPFTTLVTIHQTHPPSSQYRPSIKPARRHGRNPTPHAMKPSTLDFNPHNPPNFRPQPQAIKPSTLDPTPQTLNIHTSTLNLQPSILNPQPSTPGLNTRARYPYQDTCSVD